MAVTTTALDFKIPDGNELVRGGDDIIGHNALTAQNLHAAAQSAASALTGRVGTAEASLTNARNRLSYVEAVIAAGGGGGEPGTGSTLTPDPDNAGLYFIV